MSPYLQKFFDMSIKEHFDILYDGTIGFNGSIIMSCIVVVVFFLTFVALPYVFGRIILEKERKIRNKIYICMIDIGLVGLLAFIGTLLFKFFVGLEVGISGKTPIFDSEYFLFVNYCENIAVVCGIFYSLLLNSKVLSKYFKKLSKYKKSIFVVLLFVSLFVFYYFYYLCHIL